MSCNELANYILNEPSNITLSYIKTLLIETPATKQDITNISTLVFSSHTLTTNIWILEKMKDYFIEIDKCKDKDKLINIVYSLCHLMANCEKKNYKFFNDQEKPETFRNSIMSILVHSSVQTITHNEITQLHTYVTEEVYQLLCILYDSFIYSVNPKEALQYDFIIMRYFLSITPKIYLQPSNLKQKMDIIDIVFLLCMIYVEKDAMDDDLKEYVKCMKDLFYYKLKKKDKKQRVNILFFIIYVIIHKNVSRQIIDFEGCQLSVSVDSQPPPKVKNQQKEPYNVNNKCKFLFICTEVNQELETEIRLERERMKRFNQILREKTKDININSLLMKEPRENIEILKIKS